MTLMNHGRILYRPHRGGLSAAMAEVVEIADREALIEHLGKTWSPKADGSNVVVKWYATDDRIGWDTYMVLIDNIPVGFTNAPV